MFTNQSVTLPIYTILFIRSVLGTLGPRKPFENRRWSGATRYYTRIVLYTVASCIRSFSAEFGTKFQGEVPRFSRTRIFLQYNAGQPCRIKPRCLKKTPVDSYSYFDIEHRLVTDRQTDRHTLGNS